MSQKPLMHSSSAAVPYFILLFLLMMSCSGGWAVHAAGAKGGDVESIRFFEEADIQVPHPEEIRMFAAPSLVDVNGMLVGFAQSVPAKEGEPVYNVSAKFTERKTHEWEALKELSNWETTGSIVTRNATTESFFYHYPTLAAKGNRVYVLVMQLKPEKKNPSGPDADTMDPLLIVGESTEDQSKMTINWKPPVSLTDTLAGELKGIGKLSVGGGSGIVTSEGYIVLPVTVMTNDFRSFVAVIYSPDGEATNWKISRGVTIQGCSYHSIVEPEAGKLLMMALCDGNRRKVFESSDMGGTWTEASATLSRVWQNSPFIAAHPPYVGLTAATLQEGDNNKKVMLLTVPVHSVNEEAGKSQLHLWMSDAENRHIYDVGPVSAAGEGTIASDLLYTPDGKLFSLYEVYSKSAGISSFIGIQLAHLTGKLDQIKSVLQTWEEVDRRVSAPCNAAGHTGGGKTCSTPMPTSGLVGFLSGNATENEWRDEYLYVDAEVRGSGASLEDGLVLKGAGSWAEWSVSNQGQTQRYHFANDAFTVVATVTIHNRTQSVTSLMGVKARTLGQEGHIGLSYDKDKQWKDVTADGGSGGKRTWEEGKAYQVALVFKDGTGSAYIDGKLLGSLEDPVVSAALNANGAQEFHGVGSGQMPPQPSQVRSGQPVPPRDISTIFFGDNGINHGNRGSEVTIRNVMLYTRPLSTAELQMPIALAKPATSTWCQGSVPSPRGSQEPGTVPRVRLKALGVGRQVRGSAVFGRPETKRRLELLHSYMSLRVAPSLALRIRFWFIPTVR